MSSTRLALVLTLVLGSAAALAWPQRMVAPGALNQGHARLADACLACHVPFSGPSATRCLSCHPLHAIGVQMTTGQPRQPQRPRTPLVHRAMVNAGAACDACHAEHSRGPARSLSFRHDILPEVVRTNCVACHDAERPANALHRQVAETCASCHATTVWKPARFSHDGLAADRRTACGTCHASKRPDDTLHASAGLACGSCHGTQGWKPAAFDHQRYFRFDGDHPSTCATCHQVAGDFKSYTCYGCHEHTPAKMQAEHRRQQGQNLDRCARCHRSADEEGAEGGERESGGERRRRQGDEGGHR